MKQIADAKQKYHKNVQYAQDRIHTILQFLGEFQPRISRTLEIEGFSGLGYSFGIQSQRLVPKWRESSCHIKVPSLVRVK